MPFPPDISDVIGPPLWGDNGSGDNFDRLLARAVTPDVVEPEEVPEPVIEEVVEEPVEFYDVPVEEVEIAEPDTTPPEVIELPPEPETVIAAGDDGSEPVEFAETPTEEPIIDEVEEASVEVLPAEIPEPEIAEPEPEQVIEPAEPEEEEPPEIEAEDEEPPPDAAALMDAWMAAEPVEDPFADLTNPLPPQGMREADGEIEREEQDGQDAIAITPAFPPPVLLGSSLPDGTTHGQILWWDANATTVGWRVSAESSPSGNHVLTYDTATAQVLWGPVRCMA